MSLTTLDINSCSAEDLAKFTGISEDISKKVVEYRESKGAYYHLSEICEVEGVDRSAFIKLTGATRKVADSCVLRYDLKKITKLGKADHYSFKDIVKIVSKLPTISGAMICSEDGLPIARDFNPLLPSDKIGAALSACLKQASESLKDTPYGNLESMSMEMAGHMMSVFHFGKLYLIVQHHRGKISTPVCKVIGEILEKIPQSSLVAK